MRARSATVKGEARYQYGVLLHNLTEESYYGTCLMTEGGYLTSSWDLLHQAFKRITEWDLRLTPSKQKELRDLYIDAIANTTALELRISQSQSEYKEEIERVRISREAKREAAAAAKLKNKPPAKKKPKKIKISDIRLNTHVAMFFTWEELESPLPRPTKVPDKDGKIDMADQWRTGTVTNIVQNKWREKVYTCVFDTPGKFTSPYNAQEILEARENFIKLKSTFPGVEDSSSDDFSTSDEECKPPGVASVLANSRRKAAGPNVTIPGTQLEDDTPPVEANLEPHDGLALPEELTPDPTILKEVKQVVDPTDMNGGPDQIKVGDLVQHATPPGPSTSIGQRMKPLGSHPTPTSTKVEALTSTASTPKEEVAERNLATAPATTTEQKDAYN
jgi:hypothetical protein